MKFNLDFNIFYSKDRLDSIRSIDLSKLNKSELETISNYILYGKDDDGTSIVDKKLVQIKTKFNTFQRNKTLSLDEMMENPSFNESTLVCRNKYEKHGKKPLDREKAKDVPGMKELWEAIDQLQKIQDENTGKKEREETTPILDQKQLYYLKHQLIELRQQQYYLMDSMTPTYLAHTNRQQWYDWAATLHLNYPVFPRGVVGQKQDKFFGEPRLSPNWEEGTNYTPQQIAQIRQELQQKNKPFIDFLNTEHLQQLIQAYEEIEDQVCRMPDSPLNNLLWTLDLYIDRAKLSEQQRFIIELKKKRLKNRDIAKRLEKELGIKHQENYISTIWGKAVGIVRDYVEQNYLEFLDRNRDEKWKKCSCCGRELYANKTNFVKKKKSIDGLSNRCKSCDKEIRNRKKQDIKVDFNNS